MKICEAQRENSKDWTTGWDDDSSMAYTINKDHVVVYDDIKSMEAKVLLLLVKYSSFSKFTFLFY